MDNTKMIECLESKGVFNRNDIETAVKATQPDFNIGNINFYISSLIDNGTIARIGTNRYVIDGKKELFDYELSPAAKKIEEIVSEKYPLIGFVVWETRQLNEFLNHLLADNVIFVQVEKPLADAVFDFLLAQFPGTVLFNPTNEDVSRYFTDNLVVVTNLISEAPKNIKNRHHLTIEALVVDLFSSKLLKGLIGGGDYPLVLDTISNNYIINANKMYRYARRRNVEETIKANMDHGALGI